MIERENLDMRTPQLLNTHDRASELEYAYAAAVEHTIGRENLDMGTRQLLNTHGRAPELGYAHTAAFEHSR